MRKKFNLQLGYADKSVVLETQDCFVYFPQPTILYCWKGPLFFFEGTEFENPPTELSKETLKSSYALPVLHLLPILCEPEQQMENSNKKHSLSEDSFHKIDDNFH